MTQDTLDRLSSQFEAFPIMRAESLPTTTEIEDASKAVGVSFAADYREFLARFGGGMVGAYPIYGLRKVPVMGKNRWSVIEVTRLFRNDKTPGCAEWVVISEDLAGNPIGMDSNGVIWIHDHDFGGIERLANNFEEYLRMNCLIG